MKLSESSGTEADNLEVHYDGQEDENGVHNETVVTDPETANGRPEESLYGSGKLDQEITIESIQYSDAENPVTSQASEQQQPTVHVSHEDNNTRSMQVMKEEKFQENGDEFHLSSLLQESSTNDSVHGRIEEPVDTVDTTYSGNKVEEFTKGEPEERNQSGGPSITESNTNDVPSLAQMESVAIRKEEINVEGHNETEVKLMPLNSATTNATIVVNRTEGGEHIAVEQNLIAAKEPKTEMKQEDKGNDLGEEDSELKPMISETSRDMDLKIKHKKSQNILSGMGSKMKHSISKVKKAMACTSPQFSPDDVIIKLNKSNKS